jgi:hypothetical protein
MLCIRLDSLAARSLVLLIRESWFCPQRGQTAELFTSCASTIRSKVSNSLVPFISHDSTLAILSPPVCVIDWARPGKIRQVSSVEAAAEELLSGRRVGSEARPRRY